MNDDGTPFNMVIDRSFDVIKVAAIPNSIIQVKMNALSKDSKPEKALPTKNIVITDIKSGKRPLHGTKLFVRIPIILSLGESIILHPIIPHALHPNPMHIVKACFPCAPDFLNILSILNAARGRYPISSRKVNKGKNIAIGGSITDTTHAKVR